VIEHHIIKKNFIWYTDTLMKNLLNDFKLVFAATPLSTRYLGVRAKTGLLGVKRTCLPVDRCCSARKVCLFQKGNQNAINRKAYNIMCINSLSSLVKVRSTRLIIFDETVHGHRGIDLVIVRSTRLLIFDETVHSDGDIQTVMQVKCKHGFILRDPFLIHDLSPGLLLD
jgi:hypothetical protein